MPECWWIDLGETDYARALALQRDVAERRRQGEVPDVLLLIEHPHVITLGRNGKAENLLAGEEHLRSAGVAFHPTDRGGDITYHGPGQLVGYPILDLRYWKRDVAGYLRALEQMLIDALAEFGIPAGRVAGMTGVWTEPACGAGLSPHGASAPVPAGLAEARPLPDEDTGPEMAQPGDATPAAAGPAKIAAMGVHISRWITRHGFALNVTTDLKYFQYIIPCGLAGKPVTSMERVLGWKPGRDRVADAVVRHFGRTFEREMKRIEFSVIRNQFSGNSEQTAIRSRPSASPVTGSALPADQNTAARLLRTEG